MQHSVGVARVLRSRQDVISGPYHMGGSGPGSDPLRLGRDGCVRLIPRQLASLERDAKNLLGETRQKLVTSEFPQFVLDRLRLIKNTPLSKDPQQPVLRNRLHQAR